MEPESDTPLNAARQRGGAETRERILRCMMDMIDRGVGDDIQLRDVAREAGVSAALIIRYFGSKTELLFAALTTRIEEVANVQIAAHDAKGGFKTLDDFSKFMFALDLESAYRTVSILEMSCRWRPQNEARWRGVQEPREAILRRLLSAAAPKANPAEVEAAAALAAIAYREALRGALIDALTPAAALERFAPMRAAVLAALDAGAFRT
jgi:AcrR family transcriptional regulator